ALVRVRAEEIALPLNEARWQAARSQAVVVRERGREARRGDARARSVRYHAPPRLLPSGHGRREVRRRDEGDEVGRLYVRLGDAIEEGRTDDAAGTPDLGDVPLLDVPAVLLGAGDDRVEALRIGDDLRRIERTAHVLDEGLFVRRLERRGRTWKPGG